MACLLNILAAGGAPASGNLADNPKFYKIDPHETVITDTVSWSHPTNQVFTNHHLKLTKVELMWNKTFPVFHVAAFGADPGSGAADASLSTLLLDLLEANGKNAFKLVEDNMHDGFVVAYDRKTRRVYREMVQDEKP